MKWKQAVDPNFRCPGCDKVNEPVLATAKNEPQWSCGKAKYCETCPLREARKAP